MLLETQQGRTIVAAGGADLTDAQKVLARQRGLEVADDLEGFHAELTGVATAGQRGLLPTRGVVTNRMCRSGPNNCFEQLSNLVKGTEFDLKLAPDGRSFEFVRRGDGQ